MKHLVSLFAAALLLATTALAQDAKPLTIKVGSVAPEGTPWSEWLDGVKSRLEKDSAGKLKLKLFLGGKLGGEKEMAEETRNGNLAMFGGSAGALATYVPELAGIELPYLFSSDAEADFVLDKIRPQVTQLLAKLRPRTLLDGIRHLIGFLDGVGSNRLEILLKVPRAACHRRPQRLHDGAQRLDLAGVHGGRVLAHGIA